MNIRIKGIMFEHDDGTASYWDGFYLTEQEENEIQEILMRHDTEGCSVRGNLEDVRKEI